MSEDKLPILMCHPGGSPLRRPPRREIPLPSPPGSGLRFRFVLEPVESLAPWTQEGKPVLYWHALTYGDLWIDTPLGEVLRYTPEIQREWDAYSPYVDYQVGDLYLELLGLVTHVLEPVPADIAAIVYDRDWNRRATDFYRAVNDEEDENGEIAGDYQSIFDAWEQGICWQGSRSFDTWTLIHGLYFHFWRVGDEVSMRWEFNGKKREDFWTLPEGQFSLPVEEFEAAVFRFFEEFLAAMQQQVDGLLRGASQRTDCDVDLSRLVDSQQRQLAIVHSLKGRVGVTDWDTVRAGLARYCQFMEKAGFDRTPNDAPAF